MGNTKPYEFLYLWEVTGTKGPLFKGVAKSLTVCLNEERAQDFRINLLRHIKGTIMKFDHIEVHRVRGFRVGEQYFVGALKEVNVDAG